MLYPPDMSCLKLRATINIYMPTNSLLFFPILAFFCPALDEIANGEMSCTRGNKLGSLCKFECNEGYVLSPKDHQGYLCYKKSEWIGLNASCIEGKHEG